MQYNQILDQNSIPCPEFAVGLSTTLQYNLPAYPIQGNSTIIESPENPYIPSYLKLDNSYISLSNYPMYDINGTARGIDH